MCIRDSPNIFLATVEAYPSMTSLLPMLKTYGPKKITLAPFMIVAGDHAKNDMDGDDPSSWKSQLEAQGYETVSVLKGLGEYEGIRHLFVEHVKDAIEK